jgi:hypothetical protein
MGTAAGEAASEQDDVRDVASLGEITVCLLSGSAVARCQAPPASPWE